MSDLTTLKVQRVLKPKIEEVIPLYVPAASQQTTLAFVAWLRQQKMSPAWSGVHNAWDAKCKGKTICKISLHNGGWSALLYLHDMHRYENAIISEGLQEIILSRLHECNYCFGGKNHCVGGFNLTVLGINFTGICDRGAYPSFPNPDNTMVDDIKTLIKFEQQARSENAPHSPLLNTVPAFSPNTEKFGLIDNQRVTGIAGKTKSVAKIFDRNYSEDYGTRNGGDVLFQLDKPEALKIYSFVTGASERIPIEWVLYGYNCETESWIELDRQSRANVGIISHHTEMEFHITIPSKHQHYKLHMKSDGYIQFLQMHLYK